MGCAAPKYRKIALPCMIRGAKIENRVLRRAKVRKIAPALCDPQRQSTGIRLRCVLSSAKVQEIRSCRVLCSTKVHEFGYVASSAAPKCRKLAFAACSAAPKYSKFSSATSWRKKMNVLGLQGPLASNERRGKDCVNTRSRSWKTK